MGGAGLLYPASPTLCAAVGGGGQLWEVQGFCTQRVGEVVSDCGRCRASYPACLALFVALGGGGRLWEVQGFCIRPPPALMHPYPHMCPAVPPPQSATSPVNGA